MADAAISFAVEKLGDALIHKFNFLIGVKDEVEWLKKELESMQCFLKDAAEKQGHDERIRQWISDVREVAQDAEDAIEIFTLKLDAPTRKRDLVRRYTCFPVHVSHLNRVGVEIESIRTRLDEIGKRRERYGIQNVGEVRMDSTMEMVELRRRMAARFQKDKDVVGLNQDADLLLNKVILDEKGKGLSVAAIVGMGGIGKSTLARKIYNHPAVAARFQHRAWVVVSNEFEAEDILKEIMHQLPFCLQDPTDDKSAETEESRVRRQEMLKEMRSKHEERLKEVESVREKLRRQIMLQEMLRQRLEGKRFFIVLDDVWEHSHWQVLKNAFPDEQGEESRLLFTSRKEIFTKRHGYIHKMRVLNKYDSWKLLLMTAFIGKSEGIRCPHELEDIGTKILRKCHGLPLAITVAGGLLVNEEESKTGWDKVLKQVKNYGSETSEIGKNVSAILELSYHNLPSQLKPCFLCLAFFKEDVVIRSKMLVHIWVALGFVQVPKRGEESVEDKAMRYLDELIKRNLILVRGTSIDDEVKYCNVHDLLRELSIKKAKEEIGFDSLTSEDHERSSSSSSISKPRHRFVRGIENRLIQIDMSNKNKHIRSLFLHVEGRNENGPCLTIPSFWKGFELLRILDTQGSIFQSLPSTIRALIGIRYLRLKQEGCELTLPSWLDKLKNLEVIDVAGCKRVRFPDVTWKMHSLRHFYTSYMSFHIHEFPNSMKKSSWPNLETWKYMRSDQVVFLIQNTSRRLHELGIHLMEGDKNVGAEKLLGRLLVESRVQALHLGWHGVMFDNLPISNSLVHLTKLELVGTMKFCLIADNLPQNITHLTLSESSISVEDMQVLSMLPKLLFLTLASVYFSTVKSINIYHGGFPGLKVLHLKRVNWLENVEIEEGGMPKLQRLEIYKCPALENINNLRERIRPAEIIIES